MYDDTHKEQIGRNIKLARVKAGLAQENAADIAGVTHVTLIHTEKGRNWSRLPTLLKLAKAYGITVSELIGEV